MYKPMSLGVYRLSLDEGVYATFLNDTFTSRLSLIWKILQECFPPEDNIYIIRVPHFFICSDCVFHFFQSPQTIIRGLRYHIFFHAGVPTIDILFQVAQRLSTTLIYFPLRFSITLKLKFLPISYSLLIVS